MVTYQIQFHKDQVTPHPFFFWNSDTPFMVPAVGTYYDIPGHGVQGFPVKQVVFRTEQTGPQALVQTLLIVV